MDFVRKDDVDVVVVGGGSAGICAAVAAARLGSRVMLVEKSGRLGGMGPLAFVHTFCGLYEPGTSGAPRLANPGLPEEIERRMRERTGQDGPVAMGRVYVLPQNPEDYDGLAKELVTGEADHLEVMMGGSCTAVEQCDGGGFEVVVELGGDVVKLGCGGVVDCSADAVVAEMLGVKRRSVEAGRLQRPAFIFLLGNVGPEVGGDQFRMRLALDLVHAVRAGKLPEQVLGATVRESVSAGECFVSVDLDGGGELWDPMDGASVAAVELSGRELARKVYDFLRGTYPCFEGATPPRFPPSLGVRESYRWDGVYELTGRDLLEGVRFDDAVAKASWPLEMREDARGARFTYFENEESSDIPLRSLASADIPGVYCAGRCISASHEALASVRVMGTCFATGQAAGMAAALYARGVTGLDEQAGEVRRRLVLLSGDPSHGVSNR